MASSTKAQKPTLNIAFGNWVFNLLLLTRQIAVALVPIMDCDEVFNYWEPTHYLTHGFGLQTWEYSPEYAIRSWFYAGLHAILAYAGMLLTKSKTSTSSASVFYFFRAFYAVISALADAFLYKQIRNHLDKSDLFTLKKASTAQTPSSINGIPWSVIYKPSTLFLVFSVTATGYFHAAVSYLPSSFAMICFTFSLGYLIQYASSSDLTVRAPAAYKGLTILALGGLVGWPFALALVPYWGLHVLFSSPHGGSSAIMSKRHLNYVRFVVLRCLIFIAPVLAAMVAFDSYLYGRFTIVPLNIVLYNVLLADSESGPDIFGTEPWYYYIQNLLLNFNIVLPLALSIPVLLVVYKTITSFTHKQPEKSTAEKTKFQPLWHLIIAPFFIWFLIFTAQPHKEERFMYVAYSSLCLNAALAVSILCIAVPCLVHKMVQFVPKAATRIILSLTIAIIFVGISLSRSLSLYAYYNAPTKVFTIISQFNETNTGIPDDQQYNVCIGREWYRFPSSYFLPNNARLKFIPSGFDGLLPGQFLENNDRDNAFNIFSQSETITKKTITQKIKSRYQGIWTKPAGMNNKNIADPGKLVSLDECDFVVDSVYQVDSEAGEIDFSKESKKEDSREYKKLFCSKMIDVGASRGLARLLYLPKFLEKITHSEIKWVDFCAYQHEKNQVRG